MAREDEPVIGWPPRNPVLLEALLPAKPRVDGPATQDAGLMREMLGVRADDLDANDIATHRMGTWARERQAQADRAFFAQVRQERINLVREQLAECSRKAGVDNHAKCATLVDLYHVQRHLDRVGNYREHLPAGVKPDDLGW